MLSLPKELRWVLLGSDDWVTLVAERAQALHLLEPTESRAQEAADLAQVVLNVVPDRRQAIELYTWAWRGRPSSPWLQKARSLCIELGDFQGAAELAKLEYQKTQDAKLLVTQGLASLDAGDPVAALVPLRMALQKRARDESLPTLVRAAEGQLEDIPAKIKGLRLEAETEENIVKAGLLLQAARLSRLIPGSSDAEQFLQEAFHAYPRENSAFSLLENLWIERHEWEKLSGLYRVRTEAAKKRGQDIEVYRRAGTRLMLRSGSPGLGLRLLQQAVRAIYTRNLEDVPELIAMLTLIVQQQVQTNDTASAVRLLAEALSHPRSDDEVLWIVNRGLGLTRNEPTLQRTAEMFHALVERDPVDDIEIVTVDDDDFELLEDDDLHIIDDEIIERENRPTLDDSVAARLPMVADVSIALRASVLVDQKRVEAVTRDVSSTGLFLVCSMALGVGDALALRVALPGEDEWSLVEHELRGTVVRVESGVGYGIQFDEEFDRFAADVRALAESR